MFPRIVQNGYRKMEKYDKICKVIVIQLSFCKFFCKLFLH